MMAEYKGNQWTKPGKDCRRDGRRKEIIKKFAPSVKSGRSKRKKKKKCLDPLLSFFFPSTPRLDAQTQSDGWLVNH